MAKLIRKDKAKARKTTDEVVEDAPSTTTVDTDHIDSLLADIDAATNDSDALNDTLLLDAASQERITKVKRSGVGSAFQSHQARAWTRGGSVD